MKTKIISNEYNENVEIVILLSKENMKIIQSKCILDKVNILEENILL